MVEVVWSEEALKSWSEIVDYLILEFGIESVERFQENLEEWEDTLSHSPFIGKEEPLLSHRSNSYRSIVINRLNKLIYYLENEKIIIADLWDTRREPKEQAMRVK